MGTRTGNFPIGFRRGGGDWQKNDLTALLQWARTNGFEAIDLMTATIDDIQAVQSAGLRVGSADLMNFGNIMSTDEAQRKELIHKNTAYVKQMAGAGIKNFFTVIIPGDHAKKRSENYDLAVQAYAPIVKACREAGARLVIEGWPGGAPHYSSLCCTPETVRRFIKDMGEGVALNYDPSHLIRLEVDHIRFLREFLPYVKHVHAKDTELDEEAMYEFGTQSPTFAAPKRWGGATWRYTIPGHGITRWSEVFKILKEANYDGVISVELEDMFFNGSEDGEKAGFLHSLAFLKGT